MDAAIPVDAQNAPTGIWKTAQNAVSHSAHTPHLCCMKKNEAPKRRTLINLSTDSDQVQAEAAGYLALVLTVDVPRLGNRERDRRRVFGLPMGVRPRNLDDGSGRLNGPWNPDCTVSSNVKRLHDPAL